MSDNVATLVPRALANRERDYYSFLIDWTLHLQGVGGYGELCRHLQQAVRERTRYRTAWMFVRSPVTAEHWLMVSCAGEPEETVDESFPELELVIDDVLHALAWAREPVVIEDARLDPRTDKELVRLLQHRTIIHVPVLIQDRTMAILGIGSFGEQGVIPPRPEELEFLKLVANHAGAVITRIDDRVRSRERESLLEQARRQAEAASKARSEFLSRMCLQLRTPLSVIHSTVRLMSYELETGTISDHYLHEIAWASDHLLEMTAQILALSNLESDDGWSQAADTGIGSIIDAAIKAVALEAGARGIRLSRDIRCGRCTPVSDDTERLCLVLRDLLHNAIWRSRPGGSVELSVRESDQGIILAIRDEGVGIAEQDLDTLLRPGVGSRPRTGMDGGGVGLNMIRKLVALMGGHVNIRSRPGEGTTFEVVLARG